MARQFMMIDPVDALKQLVAIPSINPMGRTGDPSLTEARLTDHLEATFAAIGMATRRQTVAPGRDNLIAWLDGDVPPEQGGETLWFDAHQDTVPVDGMTIDPFRPEQRDGRLYGRGACDTKGGLAAILAAVSRVAYEKPCPRPTIVVSCTVNEEYGFTGVARLTEPWCGQVGDAVFRKPDAAIVAEPTDLDVVVVHKGVVRWKCHALGRAAHSACPAAGDNAIYRMARALELIERYSAELGTHATTHPLCGPATLSVGTIHGGISVNTVPDRCTIEIDCRLPPGDEPDAARQRLIDRLAQAEIGPLEHEPPYMAGPPLSDQNNGLLADRLSHVVREAVAECPDFRVHEKQAVSNDVGRTSPVAGVGRQVGVPYATNAAFFAAAGVPTVVFGPGSIAQAHTAAEWIALDQLRLAAEILYRFIVRRR